MAASDEGTTSKHVEKKLFVKLNFVYKNKSHLAIKFTSELFVRHLILRYIKL